MPGVGASWTAHPCNGSSQRSPMPDFLPQPRRVFKAGAGDKRGQALPSPT